MNNWPTVCCLLITYKRTELALRTIRGVKANLTYPNLSWHVADDGSPNGHLGPILQELPEGTSVSNAQRRGVAASMNLGSQRCMERSDYILWLEDDWELERPYDLRPAVQLLKDRPEIGMVRLGYISPGPEGQIITHADRLWWRLKKNSDTYVFSGHASLRHRRFVDAYQPYVEGLTPGVTELWMCGTFNGKPGPDIVYPLEVGQWGIFSHIGGESLKDVKPG